MPNVIQLENGLRAMKVYLAKPNVEETDLVNFCNTTVRAWLGTQGVQQAEFWTETNDEGLLQLVVAMDREDTEWGQINNVNTFLETYGSSRCLSVKKQLSMSFPPPNAPQPAPQEK